jgi:hypothetical protein
MTDTNKTPEPTPAETPTAPLPPMHEAAPAPAAVPTAQATPPYAEYPVAPAPHHGLHVPHQVSEGAIAAMVIGAVLFAMLSFGVGWTARSVAFGFQAQRAGMMGQGYGRGFGDAQGERGFRHGRRGMMGGFRDGGGQGWDQGQGQGNGWQGVPQGQGYGAPDDSLPATGTN